MTKVKDYEEETIRVAAGILGRRKSKKKALAAKRNGKLGGRPKGNSHQRRIQRRKKK